MSEKKCLQTEFFYVPGISSVTHNAIPLYKKKKIHIPVYRIPANVRHLALHLGITKQRSVWPKLLTVRSIYCYALHPFRTPVAFINVACRKDSGLRDDCKAPISLNLLTSMAVVKEATPISIVDASKV